MIKILSGEVLCQNKILKTFASNLLTKGTQLLRMFLPQEKQKKELPFCLTKSDPNPQSLMPISGEHDGNSSPLSTVFLKSLDLPHIQNCYMIDGSFRLLAEPIPVVTFFREVCGCLKNGNWRSHTDGFSNAPFLEREKEVSLTPG